MATLYTMAMIEAHVYSPILGFSGQGKALKSYFGFFRVKALKGFQSSGFSGQGLEGLAHFGSGRVESEFEKFGSTAEDP